MSVIQNSKSQEEIDREQMVAGAELARALLESARLEENFSEEKKQSLMKQCQKLCLPERFKDISVKELNELTMNDYITEASVLAIKNRKERHFSIHLNQDDGDLLKDLSKHWESKGFKVDQPSANPFILELSW